MAIDIPPPMPPIPAEVRTIEAAKSQARGVVRADFAGYQMEVVGPALLSPAEIKAAVAGAKNPSQAVLGLNDAYYAKGHLLVGLHFALTGKKLSVFVVQGKLAAVVAPPALNRFFDPLIGDADLMFAEFDRRRLLADIKAARAGEQVSVSYVQASKDPRDITMVMKARPIEDYQATSASFQIGNPGSRYLGRYFQQTSLRHTTDYGTEVVFGYESALTGLGDDPRGGDSYNHYQLALDHPTRWGVYGFDVSHVTYEGDQAVISSVGPPLTGELREVEAKITEVGLTGKQVLVSSARNRFNTYQRLEHIESEQEIQSATDFNGVDQPAQRGVLQVDEPHTSFEFGATWFHRFGGGTTVTMDVSGEWGVSSDGDNNAGTLNTQAPSSPRPVAVGRRTSEFTLLKPKFGLAIPVFGKGTLSFDLIGQFADENQVPEQQQWVLGGIGSLSAYLPGLLAGDSGYYGKVSLNLGRFGDEAFSVIPTFFIEHGAAEYEDADTRPFTSNLIADGDRQSVTDAGIRLQFKIAWEIELDIIAARHVADEGLNQDALEDLEADFFFKLKKSI